MGWEVFTRDGGLNRTGQVEFRRLTVNLRWLTDSRFIIDCHRDEAGLLPAGGGVIIARDGETVLSGLVTERSRDRDADDDTVTLAGIDDTGRLGWRLIYPDPGLPADDDGQPDYDRRTGPAEDVIVGFVDGNAGPSALNTGGEDRRLAGLTVSASAGRGTSVTGEGRWGNLLEFAATLAERGGVGFRAIQHLGVAPAIAFEVVVPQERPGARLDIDGLHGSGALKSWSYRTAIPSTTWTVAGGRGDLADRLVRQAASEDVDVWGRIETWLDRNNDGDEVRPDDDPAVQAAALQSQLDALDAAMGDALRDGQAAVDLDLEPVDTDAVRWRRDYDLGDWIRVRVDGAWMWRQVRGLEVVVDVNGEQVGPKLGDPSRGQVLRLLARLGEVERQVAERGQN